MAAEEYLRTEEEETHEDMKEVSRYSSMNKYKTDGRAICRLCGHAGDDLREHVVKEHHISAERYATQFPDWPLVREKFGKAETLSYENREYAEFSIYKLFGFYWGKDHATGAPRDRKVKGFKQKGPLTPSIDEGYVFSKEQTQAALMGMFYRDKILTLGPTGSGKSAFWQQVAARLNYNFVRINFDGSITRSDLIGQWIVKDSSMEFQYGILPSAMALHGTIICFDEWDAIGEEVGFVLQRVLESDSQIMLMEKGEEIVTLNSDNVIVATANTNGMGDDSGGLYAAGTRIQNYSQLNRFGITLLFDYLAPELEQQILVKRFGDSLKTVEIKAMVSAINNVREAFLQGGVISAPLSTRDLINWAEKYVGLGDALRSARYCFINRMPRDEHAAMEGLITRALPSTT